MVNGRALVTLVSTSMGNESTGIEGIGTVDGSTSQTLESLPQASLRLHGFDHTVGQLPEKLKFSQIDRGITEM